MPCTTVKNYITENNIDISILDIDSPPAKAECSKLGIKSIPTLLKNDGSLMSESKDIITYLGDLNAAK